MSALTRRVFPRGFLLRIFGLMVAYALARIFFFQFNKNTLGIHSTHELFQAFALGFRFDAWVVAATMLPMFFLEIASWKRKSIILLRFTSGFSAFIFALHSVFLFFEISDCEYFRFTGRRTTLGILNVSSDAFQQGFQVLTNFWHFPVLTLSLVMGLLIVWQKTRTFEASDELSLGKARLFFTTLAGIVVGVLALRGGLQTKPIAPAHAMQLGDSQLAALALSTSFQLTHSAENQNLPRINFFESDAAAQKILELPQGRFAPVSLNGYNVVVLVVESLSQEYMGYQGITANYAPFITELASRSLSFERAHANGRQSIEALPSMLASVPSLIGEPFITSQYGAVRLSSLGHTLTKLGYTTAFFHGAKNGSMHIDSMAKLFGFNQYFGRFEYPLGDKDFDGSWGIFDEPFLNFSVEKMSEFKEPFAAGIFTLSSHNPFRVPEHLKESLPAGRQPFHRSLAYADYSVRKFFEEAEKKPWYKKTLFVITGDHTAELESDLFKKEQSIFRVPILFFDPSGRLQAKQSKRLVHHADIFPTLVDLLGIDSQAIDLQQLPFGQSVFLPDQYARIANRSGDWFWYQEGSTVVRLPKDGSAEVEIIDMQENSLSVGNKRFPRADENESIVLRAKAYLQLFNNGMLTNSFVRQ